MSKLDEILRIAVEKGASDVHLKAGIIPVIRKLGQLRPLSANFEALTPEEVEQMAFSVMDKKQQTIFEDKKDIDISYGLGGVGRFRLNILRQRGTVRIVIRNIPDKVASLETLNLPPIIKKIAERERGLVLVTGATGSGKSSTLAAMVDYINRNFSKHILMIEDPTEFLIKDRKSIITQRELGSDTTSFAHSLRAALRQDPDVILIGELRDKETMEIALLAAETGHLVLSTMHTLDAQDTVTRILACFEPHQHMQIRLQLASVLTAVICQRLCATTQNEGYYPALEIMLNNARIAEIITDPSRTNELRRVIEESQTAWGMCTFDQSLMNLVNNDIISYEEALKASTSPENFAIRYNGVSHLDGKKWGESTSLVERLNRAWQDLKEVDVETELYEKSQKKKVAGGEFPPIPKKHKK